MSLPKSYTKQDKCCGNCGLCVAIQWPPPAGWKPGSYCSQVKGTISKSCHIPDLMGVCEEWQPEESDE